MRADVCSAHRAKHFKDGTDEPMCRAAMEIQTESRLADTVGEAEGGTN